MYRIWIFLFAIASASEYEPGFTRGLFPNVFNLAATSTITVNATCGETNSEVYCKLVEHVYVRRDSYHRQEQESGYEEATEPQCGVCDKTSIDKQHPISYAIDGTNRYWQSPTLQNGKHFEWITITLDLKQVYQVAYVIVKAAISPRPGNWILERSIDGITYRPWQYYALTDSDCWETYGIRPTIGVPYYRSDNEVICSSYYSKLNPLENGEIHTSLVNGRPGADGPTEKLREFTKARYVRLRLQKIRTLNADLMSLQGEDSERIDKTVTRRYFYSIKDISVGGQCMCSGHAANCSYDRVTGKQHCKCEHHTCGESCEKCCPMFNQRAYQPGTSLDAALCEKCECHGHADSCHFDSNVATLRKSINADGKYVGGGVCDKCKHHTTGVNCELCEDGYFRPQHLARNHTKPCRKCQCTGPGMTGICIKDDSHMSEKLHPGDCLCKVGFEGKKCDRCSVGYRNYPLCEPCPCHSAGTIGGKTCEGECICKAHVEGSRCDRCKRGFYHLSADNPDGCSQCFCFGLTDECIEGDWGVKLIEKPEDWRVTDLKGRKTVKPLLERKDVVIANDDMSQFSNYYWLAPPDYLGKKLYSYGADLKFSISYVIARGDTSGTYTESADIVIEGNGVQLGYNWGSHSAYSDSMTITMPLREQSWFVLGSNEQQREPVSRETFTLVLNDLKRLLIRAKFHTDQIEGRLHNIGMETASEESNSIKKLKSVEKCVCPPGYGGLSCQECAPGYRGIKDSSVLGISCEACECYNHAESCDAETGRCQNCLHHTMGVKCDTCIHGYYGNATIGTPNDCKQCACPLSEPENNFSPSCVEVRTPTEEQDYFCDQCPHGYDGNKCQRCAEGFFGNPQILGGFCQPCDCSGNSDTTQPGWCDTLTGQCHKCLDNTGGWNCGECLTGYYGDSKRRTCKACGCSPHGSLSTQCDHTTGQCICKPHFVGRMCDRCAQGYGNIEAGCVPCKCNHVGSRTETCDPVSGHCQCKPGVFGTTCSHCLENYFGFSSLGCRECNCDPYGSISLQCDEGGQCPCKPRVIGLNCDRCEDGHWNIRGTLGCEKCHCNKTGSTAALCNKNTGQCDCKPGVGGNYCDQCLPGYFKFNPRGCRKCDPCDVAGHICHPENGRCVCPQHTTGRRCQNCIPNAWGYDGVNGCQLCNCNPQGSPNQRCDPVNGNCICLEGFEGRLCDQCRHGFYNFPNCHKCDCSVAGTDAAHCRLKEGICQCSEQGQCFCKEHVTGPKCNKCQEDAFGLSADNKKGCHKCFCFGRTRTCNQANMYWTKMSFPSQDAHMEVGTSEIPSVFGFKVIPRDLPSRRLGIPYVLDKPLYWSLQKDNFGDKVLSYNGYLTFYMESHSASHFPEALLQSYPLVIIQGNQRIVLFHSQTTAAMRRPYKVKLSEEEWRNMDNPQVPVRKDDLMVALQNLQSILIRATDGPDVKYTRLYNVTLDVATSEFQTPTPAEGIEVCRCPRQYTGASCQDPAPGYYRKRKPNYLDSKDVLDLVGWAEPCNCNNHTNICDQETGICINCQGNTMGDHCDRCQKGHYGTPSQGPCRPCSCPDIRNSFSDTCIPDSVDYRCVDCQAGYTGRHCESCEKGYYGNPRQVGGRCVECKCNPYGSKSSSCDQTTGQCHCLEGISGRDCTVCSHGFILTEYGCKSCEDECTGVLLNELFGMKLQLEGMNLTDLPRLPWGYLTKMKESEIQLRPMVDNYQKIVSNGKELINNFTFYFDLEAQADALLVRAMDFTTRAGSISKDAKDTLDEAEKLFVELNRIWRNIKDLASELDRHGVDPTGPSFSTERMLMEAERILQELKDRSFFPKEKENAERELRKAHNLLDKIKDLTRDRGHIDDLQQKLDVLTKILEDATRIINQDVRRPVDKTVETLRGSRLRYNEAKDAVGRIAAILSQCNSTLKEAAEILAAARGHAIDAAIKFEYLPKLLRDLENATNSLEERRGVLASLNPKYNTKYVIPCRDHAEDLERQGKRLADLFTATKELSEFPLQAANAYKNIVDAINAAEKAAQEADRAADKAYNEAYPGTDDALTAQAQEAKAKSMQLLSQAQQLNEEDVPELEVGLRTWKKNLSKLAEDVAYGKRKNDIIRRDLDALPVGTGKELREATLKAQLANEKAKLASDKIDRLDDLINKEIKPRHEAIRAGTVGGLSNLTRIINKAREDVRGASRLADSADASARRVRKHNAQLQLNLKDLKDKILLARQKSSSIRVAVTTDLRKKCFRSYRPTIEPSTTNSIVLNFATESGDPDSLLFFMGSSREEDFMAIEMFNRKIRFLWNVGGGTHVIQHNMTIETNINQLLNNEQWYKIEATRIGNLGTLSVKRTPDGQKPDPYEVSGASVAGYTKMDLDTSSNLFVGGFPENYLAPTELLTTSFSGCLYTLELNGKSIGLWNFLSSKGCSACKEGATEDIDISAYEFQGGNSYAIVTQNPYYRKSDLYTVLNFKTLNEDALLFFSCNSKTGDFISLELKKGKVVYQLKFGGRSQMFLETKKKYNNGKWTRVEAAREKFEAQILVEDELLEESDTRPGSSALDLKDSALYYGGVPPNFTQESWPGITFKSFFGCLRDLQMDSTPIALSRGSFYGMTVGCSIKALKVCTFVGGGHLELNSQPLSSDSSFSFSFFTQQKNALLMLSTFAAQESDPSLLENYYSVSLKDGRIDVRINGDSGKISMTSDNVLGTGFHTVTFIRKNRRLLLRIDDIQEADFRLSGRSNAFIAPKKGGLFFGGVRKKMSIGTMTASENSFIGVIQDVIFNDKLLQFEEAVDYKAVDFGFTDINLIKSEEFFQQMTVPEEVGSCSSTEASRDDSAFSPSSGAHGFLSIDVDKIDLLRNFKLALEFRTYFPNGVLFFSENGVKKQEMTIYLRNDSVVVDVKRKHHLKSIRSKELERGQWHKVEFVKSALKMTLFVNNKLISSTDLFKKLSFKSPLYIGGVPQKIRSDETPSYYGCMRNLHINGIMKRFSSTYPCFKHVQPGNYFLGDNHVVYDSAFYLGNAFTINVEYRTDQSDGDLLYIHSNDAKLFFRLQIIDDQVLLTLYSETDMQRIQLSRNIERDNNCDNMWHNVNFSYKHGNLSLRLDDAKPVDKTLKKSLAGLNHVEVHIGGSPKKHSKDSSRNFLGCMRNIAINEEYLDLRAAENHPSVLYSCPTS